MNKDKDLIKNIQHLVRCPNCSASYEANHISILGGLGEMFLVHLDCSFCGTPVLATIVLRQEGNKGPGEKPNEAFENTGGNILRYEPSDDAILKDNSFSAGSKEAVSTNDVLDMHEFLNNFDGDFESIING